MRVADFPELGGSGLAWCAPGKTAGLSEAIERLYRELPGWWFSVGNCHLSADATVGPDRVGPDAWLLQFKEFDDGIDGDLIHPTTLADALNMAISLALAAKARIVAERDLTKMEASNG